MTLDYEILEEWFGDPDRGEYRTREFFGNFEQGPNGCRLWKGPFWDQGYGRYIVFRQNQRVLGIPVKVNIDSGGKPNGIPERR